MKLTRPSEVRELFKQLEFTPKRTLGQNFLIDGNILKHIVQQSGAGEADTILEIGPGLGVLSEALLPRVRRLIAIEKDPALYDFLRRQMGTGRTNKAFDLRLGDATQMDYGRLREAERIDRLVANLPYSVASRILVDCCAPRARLKSMTVTVQLDVAQRLCAEPGTRQRGLLGICAQATYRVKRTQLISPRCFFPVPQVKSAVVHFERRTDSPVQNWPAFVSLVKRGFGQRRKQLKSILQVEERDRATKAQIDMTRRPESLSLNEWALLAQ